MSLAVIRRRDIVATRQQTPQLLARSGLVSGEERSLAAGSRHPVAEENNRNACSYG